MYKIEKCDGYDPNSLLTTVKQSVINLLAKNRQTKVAVLLRCAMEKPDPQTGGTVTTEVPFWGGVEVILEATDLNVLYETWSSKILESIGTFQNSGSGWVFISIISLEIHMVRYQPLSGSSHILLPKELASKKTIINLKK